MTQPPNPHHDLSAILADSALFGLTRDERTQLDRNTLTHNEEPTEAERIAAGVYLASIGADLPLPAGLRYRLLADAKPEERSGIAPLIVRRDVSVGRRRVGVALALAASIALALTVWRGAPESALPPAAARQAFLESHPELTPVAWTSTDDSAGKEASGEVVWSDAEQKGYMVFAGLPANEPTESQYQLWVFDAERDQRYPVDGGVFDIPPGETEVVVPIQVKLPVSRATMFAVTIEPPGGVVVSDRARLPLLAKFDPED